MSKYSLCKKSVEESTAPSSTTPAVSPKFIPIGDAVLEKAVSWASQCPCGRPHRLNSGIRYIIGCRVRVEHKAGKGGFTVFGCEVGAGELPTEAEYNDFVSKVLLSDPLLPALGVLPGMATILPMLTDTFVDDCTVEAIMNAKLRMKMRRSKENL